jgi:hypothetical protein
LGGVEVDNAQRLSRKSEFSAAREFDECWKFSREMIGDADDLRFFVDQLGVRMNRKETLTGTENPCSMMS